MDAGNEVGKRRRRSGIYYRNGWVSNCGAEGGVWVRVQDPRSITVRQKTATATAAAASAGVKAGIATLRFSVYPRASMASAS